MMSLRYYANRLGWCCWGAAVAVHRYYHGVSYAYAVLAAIAAAYCMQHDLRNGGPPPC